MEKVLFVTNYPSPYRVSFFGELGKHTDLTVLYFERPADIKHRDPSWFISPDSSFKTVQLSREIRLKKGVSLCLDVVDWLKKGYDHIVLSGYSDPTVMLAIAWLRCSRVPFYMEVDGGLIRQDSRLKYAFKHMLVSSAAWWISSGTHTTRYLVHYGAREDRVFSYPFTSLWEKDILQDVPSREEKILLRQELGLAGDKIILSVGQFIHRKGYDVLLHAAAALEPGIHIYILGGEPTEEYLDLCRKLSVTNVHFAGFTKKERLQMYYKAADLFVLPTREDIWGLVVGEAMAFGLPVITTDRCVAGLELVKEGVNGGIVPVGDQAALADGIHRVLGGDASAMAQASLEIIRPYTIENMAKAHVKIFERRGS